MHNATKLNRIGQWAFGSIALSLAVTAGAVGLTLNVAHGLKTGLAVGVIFGLADASKILIPIIGGAIGWTHQLRITAAICVAVSLWAATSYYADKHGAEHANQQHGASVYHDAEARIAELQAHAASLASLAALEGKKGGCGPNCRDLMKQASDAAQKVQEARSARAQTKPVEVAANAERNSAIETGLFLALVEVLTWFSVPAMAMLGQAMKKQAPAEPAPVVVKVRKPRKRKPARKDWTKLETYAAPPVKKLDGRTREARALKKMAATVAND